MLINTSSNSMPKSLVCSIPILVILCVVSVRCSVIDYVVGQCIIPPNTTFEIDGLDLQYIALTLLDKDLRRYRYAYNVVEQLAKHREMDFNRKTILFCTGFLDSPNFFFMDMLGKEYLKLNYNVLGLDANYYYTMDYPMTTRYTVPVGKRAAEMFVRLTKLGFDPKKLEIIALSLGCHTMANIGKEYHRLTGVKIARMTGLDPSGPCFPDMDDEHKLQRTDADFVDVIKTNIDNLGSPEPQGHVNFYVNGGVHQPGDIWWLPCTEICSHVRSLYLWFSSLVHISKDAFIAIQCDSAEQARNHNCFDRKPRVTNTLGLNVNKSKKGIFYLVTDYKYPYFLGKDGLNRKYKYNSNVFGSINLEDAMKFWLRKED